MFSFSFPLSLFAASLPLPGVLFPQGAFMPRDAEEPAGNTNQPVQSRHGFFDANLMGVAGLHGKPGSVLILLSGQLSL